LQEHAAILLLTKPIRVVAEKDDQFNETRDNVKEVQLINLKRVALATYFAKKVKVTGKLSSAITGHYHTDVLMEVDKIHLFEDARVLWGIEGATPNSGMLPGGKKENDLVKDGFAKWKDQVRAWIQGGMKCE
jgi:Domain of unknown function (DUF4431)